MHPLLKITSAFVMALLLPKADGGLIVGSYNIRNDNPKDAARGDSWPQRVTVIAGLIRFHAFDVLGTQEGLHHQLTDLNKLLPNHAYTGCGREDGKEQGEYAAIFYSKTRFNLIESGTFWLSLTPEHVSRGWDAEQPRICTWARLARTDGGDEFFVFNTHFDHRGELARLESARLVSNRIRSLANGKPAILTGDFNEDQTSESYRILRDSGLLADSFETSIERYALNGTANGFNPGAKTESRIDHVFHSKHFKALRYGVLTDTYRAPSLRSGATTADEFPRPVESNDFDARLPSDHFPVLVEFK